MKSSTGTQGQQSPGHTVLHTSAPPRGIPVSQPRTAAHVPSDGPESLSQGELRLCVNPLKKEGHIRGTTIPKDPNSNPGSEASGTWGLLGQCWVSHMLHITSCNGTGTDGLLRSVQLTLRLNPGMKLTDRQTFPAFPPPPSGSKDSTLPPSAERLTCPGSLLPAEVSCL